MVTSTRLASMTWVSLWAVLGHNLWAISAEEVLRNSSRECAICHIRWVDALVRTDDQAGPMEKVLERQAGSGDMCLSCHDGSVADSRFKVWSTKHHTTGQAPSPGIRIPTDRFPLDENGHMTCSTCHTAHAVPDSSDIRTVVFLRQPNVDSSLCLACHEDHAQKNAFQHTLGAMETPVPQVILDAGGKTSEDGYGVICQTCHEPHGARNDWMLVLPPSTLCIACHTDKDPDAASRDGMPFHKIGQSFSGFVPPKSLLDELATFGPAGELSCLSCHRLHDASGAKPLLIKKNEDSGLCIECHKEEKAMLGSPHDLRDSAPEVLNAKGQSPSESGPCGACHRIHGWAREVQEAEVAHSAGCLECHETGGAGSQNRPYLASHPIGMTLPDGQTTSLPLDEATGTMGCLTCHDPHTPLSGAKTMPDGPSPRSFLRAPGSALCVQCHDREKGARFAGHDPTGFDPALRRSLSIGGSMGSCRVCHSAHNAQGPHLWARIPHGDEANSHSALCKACHNADLVTPSLKMNHPDVTSEISLPRTGPCTDNPAQTGCGACHDAHAGPERPSLLKRAPETLCSGCHEEEAAVEGSVHDPGTAPWTDDVGFVSHSPCLDCHPIHASPSQGRLWKALEGDPEATHLCTVCHRPGAPGTAVVTPHVGKPVPPGSDGATAHLLDGSHDEIRCSTCHNIHDKDDAAWLLKAPVKDAALCLTCHPEKRTVLATDHDLRLSAPEAQNVRKQGPVESGPCGVCHKIHGTHMLPGVWAQSSTITRDYGRHHCTDCHSPGQMAQSHVPAKTGHPELPLMNRTGRDRSGAMPTFTQEGAPSLTGHIACQTCHDPHLAPSENGDVGHKFLRRDTQQRLCVDCHGLEGLWRYLYYHKEERKP